nr:hypothetical protein TgIb.1530c [Toxoplasma gondii RH]
MAPCSCAVSAEYAELHPPDLLEDESLLARIECLETPQKEGLFSRKFDPRKSCAKTLSDIRGGNGGTTLHLPFSGFSHQAVPGKQKQIKQRISSEEKAGTPPSSESHSSSSPLSCSVSPSFRDAVALLQRLVPPPVSCSSLPLLASPDSSPRFFPPECPSVSSLSSLASALGSKHLQPSSCASSLSAPSELPSVSLADSPAPVSLSSCDASPCSSNSSSSSVSPSSSHIPHILASLTATHADAHTQLHRNTREAVEACSSLSGEETGKPCLPQVASPSAEVPRPASKHREKPLSRLCLTTVQATSGETEEKGVLLEASGELKRLRSRGEFGSRDQSVELRSIGLFLLSLLPDSDFRFGGVPESGDTQFPFGNRSESSDFFSCLGVAEEERDVRVSPRDANEKRRGEKRCEWSPVSKIRNPQTDKTDEIAHSGALPDLNKRAVQSILDAVAVYVQSRELASRDASGSPSLPSVELGNSATREAPFLRVEVCSDGAKDLESLQVSTRSPLPAPLSSELFFLSVLHRVNGATTPSVSHSSSASLRVEFPQRQLHLCTLKALRALQGVPGWTSTAASILALWLTDFRYQFSGSLETPRDALLDEERLGLAWQLVCGEAGGLGLLLEALRRPAASKSLSRRILAEDARVCAQDRKRHEEKEQGVAKAGEAGRGRGDMSEKDKVCVCAPRASSTFSVEKARFFASLLGLLFAPLTTLTCRSRTAALVAWMLCEESGNAEECSNPNTDKREKRANEEENETSLLCLLLNRLCDSLPTLSPLFQRREGETWRRRERKEEERTTNTVCTSEDREGCALLALLELLDALVELLACSFFYKSAGARCTYTSREQRRARDGQVENGEEGESGSDVVARKADGSTSPVKKSTVPAAADVCRVLLVLRTAEVLTACATGDSSLFCSLSSFSVLFEKVPSPIAPNYMALCSLTKLVPLLTQCDSSSSSFSVSSSSLPSYSPFSSSVSSSAEAFQSGEEEERASRSSFKTVSALCVSVLQCVARALSRSACVLRSDLQAEVRDRGHRREEETQRGDKETVGRKAGFMASRSREDVRGGEEDVQAERGESKEAREGDEQKGAARRLFAEAAQAESAGETGGSSAEGENAVPSRFAVDGAVCKEREMHKTFGLVSNSAVFFGFFSPLIFSRGSANYVNSINLLVDSLTPTRPSPSSASPSPSSSSSSASSSSCHPSLLHNGSASPASLSLSSSPSSDSCSESAAVLAHHREGTARRPLYKILVLSLTRALRLPADLRAAPQRQAPPALALEPRPHGPRKQETKEGDSGEERKEGQERAEDLELAKALVRVWRFLASEVEALGTLAPHAGAKKESFAEEESAERGVFSRSLKEAETRPQTRRCHRPGSGGQRETKEPNRQGNGRESDEQGAEGDESNEGCHGDMSSCVRRAAFLNLLLDERGVVEDLFVSLLAAWRAVLFSGSLFHSGGLNRRKSKDTRGDVRPRKSARDGSFSDLDRSSSQDSCYSFGNKAHKAAVVQAIAEASAPSSGVSLSPPLSAAAVSLLFSPIELLILLHETMQKCTLGLLREEQRSRGGGGETSERRKLFCLLEPLWKVTVATCETVWSVASSLSSPTPESSLSNAESLPFHAQQSLLSAFSRCMRERLLPLLLASARLPLCLPAGANHPLLSALPVLTAGPATRLTCLCGLPPAAGKETSARRQGDACGEKDTETDADDRLRAKARLGRGAREEGSPADRRQCLCGSVFLALHSLLLRSSCALLSDVPAAFGCSFSPQQRVRQNACLSSSENSFPSPNTVNTGAGGPAFVACKNVDARTALRVRLGASVESERPSISFLAPPLRVENEVSRQRDALGRLHPVCSSSSLETVEPESKRTFVLEERTVGLSTSERAAVGGPGRRSAFRERRLSSLPPVAEWLQRHSREDTLSSAYEILHATLRTLSEMIPSSETKQRDTLSCPYPFSPSSPPLSFSSSSSSLPSSSSPLSFSSRSSAVPDTQCCRSPLSAWGSAECGEEATESRSVCTAAHEFSKDLVRSSWQRLFDTATLYSDLRVPILLLAERLFHASPEETATPKAQPESLHTAVPLGGEERKRRLQFEGDSQEIRRKWQEADEQAHQERVVLSFYRQTVRAVLLQFFHVSVSEETRMKENSNHRDRESCLEEEQRREVCRLLRLRSVAAMHAPVVPKEDGLLKSRTERRGESEDGARPLSATQSSKETEKEDTERGETAGKDTERNEETKGKEKEESERNAKGAVPGEIEEMKTTTTDVEVEEEGETRKNERGRTRRYGTLLAWLQQEGEEEELLLLSLARLAALLGSLEEEEGDRREGERRPRSVFLKEMHHLLLAAYEQECEDRKEPERL